MGDLSDGEARIPVLEGGPAPGQLGPAPGQLGPAPVDAFVERFRVDPTGDGPLRGMTFAVKDVFDVAGHHTGCGNPVWRATHPAAADHAAVVQTLLEAGARLLGKTRTDEMAYSIEGWNFHEGAPRNAAAPGRLTGGSSSGSAAAVAAGEVDFALGTDTAGSVRVPAAWCGLMGLRPTHARISVGGLTPLAPSFDTVGWMARSAATMRLVGEALLDPRAAAKSDVTLVRDTAVERHADAGTAAALEPLFERCALRGLALREVALGVDPQAVAEVLRILQGSEAWRVHGRWIESAHPRFGPGVAERFAAARAITADQVAAATAQRAAINARLDEALPPGLILCLPTVPGPAPRRDAPPQELQGQRTRTLRLTALASLSGRPQMTVPVPSAVEAPVGFSLLGWRNGDERLLEVARSLYE